jgi:hypothetical protein
MGGFFSKDTLSEFRISLLNDEIPDIDAAMLLLVTNVGQLASLPRVNRVQAKRHRIVTGAGHMYRICNDICDELEPDPSDLDDLMVMSQMCKYRVKQTRNQITTDEWLQLWDDTVAHMEKIYRNVDAWKHMHYYYTMCHVLKAIKFIYKRRCCF